MTLRLTTFLHQSLLVSLLEYSGRDISEAFPPTVLSRRRGALPSQIDQSKSWLWQHWVWGYLAQNRWSPVSLLDLSGHAPLSYIWVACMVMYYLSVFCSETMYHCPWAPQADLGVNWQLAWNENGTQLFFCSGVRQTILKTIPPCLENSSYCTSFPAAIYSLSVFYSTLEFPWKCLLLSGMKKAGICLVTIIWCLGISPSLQVRSVEEWLRD